MAETGFYTVQRGDTLGKIAQRLGIKVSELAKINGLASPHRIEEGQKLALTREAVCKVGFQFLDRDRNPIRNAKVRLEFCGKVIDTTSGEGGRTRDIITDSPLDTVKVWIARYDGNWKLITEVISDWGNKLVTLTSPKIRVEASTHPHPQDSQGQPLKDKPRPPLPPIPEIPRETTAQGKPQSTFGDGKGTKIKETQDAQGLPVARATSDQAGLDFLQGYTGEKITEADYEAAANELGCEVAVIKAIGEQESGKLRALGLGSFDKNNRPTILYERHYFSRLTAGKFDKVYPYISSPKEYKKGTARNAKGKKYDDGQHYGLFSWQYGKLSKAYALDKDAAIMSCSWGKFQIMGENYKACGFTSPSAFASSMCKSEREHLKAMVLFCKSNRLQSALKDKNWAVIARAYNGPGYKKNEYDKKLEALYDKFR